jgi:hypothetical protein
VPVGIDERDRNDRITMWMFSRVRVRRMCHRFRVLGICTIVRMARLDGLPAVAQM